MSNEIDSSENLSNNISFIDDEDAYKTISKFEIVSVDEAYNKILETNKKSRPFLSKFEKCKLLGVRAEQLSRNMPSCVELNGNESVLEIAEKELFERKIPMIIRRFYPNGTYEDWTLDELIY